MVTIMNFKKTLLIPLTTIVLGFGIQQAQAQQTSLPLQDSIVELNQMVKGLELNLEDKEKELKQSQINTQDVQTELSKYKEYYKEIDIRLNNTLFQVQELQQKNAILRGDLEEGKTSKLIDSLYNELAQYELFYANVEQAKISNEQYLATLENENLRLQNEIKSIQNQASTDTSKNYVNSLIAKNKELQQALNDTIIFFKNENSALVAKLDLCDSDYNNMFAIATDSITKLNNKITLLENQEPLVQNQTEYIVDPQNEKILLDSINTLVNELQLCNSDYNNMFAKANDSIKSITLKLEKEYATNKKLADKNKSLEETIKSQNDQNVIAQNIANTNVTSATQANTSNNVNTSTKQPTTTQQKYSVGELFNELNSNAQLIFKENSQASDYLNDCNVPAFTSFYKHTQENEFDKALRSTYLELSSSNDPSKVNEFTNLLVQANNQQKEYLEQAKDNDEFSCDINRAEFDEFFKAYQTTIETAINLSNQ